MNEERARDILGSMIQPDNSLNAPIDYIYWEPGEETWLSTAVRQVFPQHSFWLSLGGSPTRIRRKKVSTPEAEGKEVQHARR